MAGERVVVAGRDPRVFNLIAQVVTETTGDTTYLADPMEDLAQALSELPSALLLLVEVDRYMPERLAAVRLIRDLYPGIVVTVLSFGQGPEWREELGCQESLDEPIELEELEVLLRKYL